MSILAALLHNAGAPAETRRPDDPAPIPDGYRGSLQHDLTDCTGCTTCAYVCSPGAITFRDVGDGCVAWQYDAGRCTFCGRCAEFCPTRALGFSPEPLPVSGDRWRHRLTHWLEPRACTRCGQPVRPLPESTLIRLYGAPVPADMAAQRGLCETCRNRLAGEAVKRGFLGQRRADEH